MQRTMDYVGRSGRRQDGHGVRVLGAYRSKRKSEGQDVDQADHPYYVGRNVVENRRVVEYKRAWGPKYTINNEDLDVIPQNAIVWNRELIVKEVKDLIFTVDDDKGQIAQLWAKVEEQGAQIVTLQGRVEQLEQVVSDHDNRIATLESDVSGLKHVVNDHVNAWLYWQPKLQHIQTRYVDRHSLATTKNPRGLLENLWQLMYVSEMDDLINTAGCENPPNDEYHARYLQVYFPEGHYHDAPRTMEWRQDHGGYKQ